MEDLTTPQVLTGAFAYNGQKNTIPDAPTGSFLASIQQGFPPITMMPKKNGGKPVLFFHPKRRNLYFQSVGIGCYRRLSGRCAALVRGQQHG